MSDNWGGCLVCGQGVIKPALLCSDCRQEGYLTGNGEVLTLRLTPTGPEQIPAPDADELAAAEARS